VSGWRAVLTGAVRVDRPQLAGGDALAYAVGVAGVLAAADAVGGPDVAVLAASGALNAGAVALTSGLDRPRVTMAVAALTLAMATTVGDLTAWSVPLHLIALAGFAVVAGLLAEGGAAASVVGVQALVGFVTLGKSPQTAPIAFGAGLLILAGAATQIAGGILLLRWSRRWSARRQRHGGRQVVAAPDAREGVSGEVRRFAAVLAAPGDAARWHAARLAATVVVAELIGARLPGGRGYWVALTVLNVLKPDWQTTATRGIDRGVGTLAGVVVVGLALTELRPGHPPGTAVLVVALGVVCWAAFTVQRANYALWSTGLVGVVVLFIALGRTTTAGAVAARALDTVIGSVLAVAVHVTIRGPVLRCWRRLRP
jgi:hypothetical protein